MHGIVWQALMAAGLIIAALTLAHPAQASSRIKDIADFEGVRENVLVGYGRVGSLIGEGLVRGGAKLLVIEASDEGRDKARSDGIPVIVGNAAAPGFLEAANIAGARRLFVTVPEAFEAGQVVQQARAANPDLDIVARAHSDAAVDHLKSLGANVIVMGEQEIAQRMIEHARTSS